MTASGSGNRRRATAFNATITLDPDIAIAAISGRSVKPKAGTRTPAATGSATVL